MTDKIKFKIDGKEFETEKKQGKTIWEAANENNVYIPILCHMKGLISAGSCRICNVKVNGRFMTACSTPIEDGMEIENDTEEIKEMRKVIIETLFVEGNHFCPSCEKSGDCELQALGYLFGMDVPRFEYSFPNKKIESGMGGLIIDHNRCIKCKRCVRKILKNGRNVFAFKNRAGKVQVNPDKELVQGMSDDELDMAMNVCPVGAIIKKERGFVKPIGKRKYDTKPISET
jgi:[NiFe] hydrogenase diaphorase moiety small subunit